MGSIADRTGQGPSITDANQALALFANRSALIRHFATYLNGDPPREQILFIHGPGGNGKTLLLRYFEKHCCKRLTPVDWLRAKGMNDDQFRDYLKTYAEADPVAKASLDFSAQPTAERDPKDPFSGLLYMRAQLAEANIPFPLFDFACTWYVHKTRRWTLEDLQKKIPTEGLSVVLAVTKALLEPASAALDLAQVVLDAVDRHLQGRFSQYMQTRKLSKAAVQMIMAMDENKDLVGQMPVLFAQDLNAAMQTYGMPRRAVLLFDGHDALWRAKDATDAADTWLRTLLVNLHLDSGIVAVISGREIPQWDGDGALPPYIPAAFVDDRTLGGLKKADATTYLVAAGVKEEAVRERLLTMADAGQDQVHPLLLGLLVDVYRMAGPDFSVDLEPVRHRVQDKLRVVLERLLHYAPAEIRNGVQALSACRNFDRDIHKYLGEKLDFGASREAFDALVKFSFVSATGEGRYRIHDLLQRLLRESGAAFLAKADPVLEEYYRQQPTGDAAAVEAIYHATRWDAERGIAEWFDCMAESLRLSRYERCRLLLDLRGHFELRPLLRGEMGRLAGKYYTILAQYGEAVLELRAVVTVCDRILGDSSSDDLAIQNLKGQALQLLGALYAGRSQYAEALQSYHSAIETYEKALRQSPSAPILHNNKGNAHVSLGALHGRLSQHAEAMENYRLAIAAYDQSLVTGPADPEVLSNKGVALIRLGDLFTDLALPAQAMESYRGAIAAYDLALSLTPGDPAIRNNQGLALQAIGDICAGNSQYSEAMESYLNSLTAFDQALAQAPEDLDVLQNRGNALTALGVLHTGLEQPNDALESYLSAIAAYDKALGIAPEAPGILYNKGIALSRTGDLHTERDRYQMALESYRMAVATFDQALAQAQDDVEIQCNRGAALMQLGDLYANLGQHPEAIDCYHLAMAAFDRVLAIAPADREVLTNKGLALVYLGDVYVELAQVDDALHTYRAAIEAFDQCLAIAPDQPEAQEGREAAIESVRNLSSEA